MESTSLGLPSQENLPSPLLTDVDRPAPVPIPKAKIERTDSAQSSSKASLLSHQSVPVTGTFPLGTLRVHQVMDSPRLRQPEARPQADLSDMPPLEDAPSGGDTAPLDGDIFVILDLPPNSTVGCDARAINTGASGFKGIRDIPPGPHFVWVSEPSVLSRCGYWFVAQDGGRVRVKQWDKYNEVLAEPASKFELRDHRDNVASLYPQLVSFRHGGDPAAAPAAGAGSDDETAQLWHQLTSGISEGLLERVTGRRAAGEWLVATSDTAQGEAGFPQTTTQLYKAVVGPRELEFLFPEGDVDLTAAAGSHHHDHQASTATDADADTNAGPPDTSAEILRLVDTPGTGVSDSDVTGELQLTFLTGLHLSNLSCVDQWWHLVLKVVLRAHRLALLRPRLAAALVRTLHAQMVYDERYIAGADDPKDEGTTILDIVPGNKRKLRRALALYRRRLDELLLDLPRDRATAEQGAVGKAFGELEAWFWKFGWDLRTGGGGEEESNGAGGQGGNVGRHDDDDDHDDDDYKPVIVDLDADGREVGLISFS
ncbi:hypothetical protein INS49_006878 [Diaporthe citri]|uniref:uncharacterized protein n=1 Tax=Diaporthe citri TaxID=83186 RepID=UPI001C7F66FF|nr:uncharacterized protein INS49_006878 [Diaporthe citri]KAG6365269.1 hypothetical protein INS49_006878 [Diaporthe citri]